MKRLREARLFLCLAIMASTAANLVAKGVFASEEDTFGQASLFVAQQESPPAEPFAESLEIYARYPIVQNTTASVLTFDIYMHYEGIGRRVFDLEWVAPEGWAGQFRGGYPEAVISAFAVEPGKKSDRIRLTLRPTTRLPEPGEYEFIVRASSESVTASTRLKAILVEPSPKYYLYMTTSTMRREFQIKPNQDNHVSFELINYQTGVVKDIVLTVEAPEGWQVSFTPGSIASLEPRTTREIDLIITPASNAEAGDYPVRVRAAGDKAEAEYAIRVNVAGTELSGAAGIGIAAGVVAGLIVWFRRAEGAKSGAKKHR